MRRKKGRGVTRQTALAKQRADRRRLDTEAKDRAIAQYHTGSPRDAWIFDCPSCLARFDVTQILQRCDPPTLLRCPKCKAVEPIERARLVRNLETGRSVTER